MSLYLARSNQIYHPHMQVATICSAANERTIAISQRVAQSVKLPQYIRVFKMVYTVLGGIMDIIPSLICDTAKLK